MANALGRKDKAEAARIFLQAVSIAIIS